MTGYRFYRTADIAQDRIWRDTAQTWGVSQAVTYIKGLHAHLQRLAENRSLWRRLPQNLAVPADVKREAYFSGYERHYVFFRELDNGDIGVISILHDHMDVPVRLAEDLAALLKRPDRPQTSE